MIERHILFLYRICNKLYYKNYKRWSTKWILSRIVTKLTYKYYAILLEFIYGAYLPYKIKIGKNLKLNHSFHGIFISENTTIGDNCTLLQHITIGSNQPISSEAPLIGDNVFIGVNCNIVGKTEIGNNCTIGAGVTIANSIIPENSIVVGQKFRVISKNE